MWLLQDIKITSNVTRKERYCHGLCWELIVKLLIAATHYALEGTTTARYEERQLCGEEPSEETECFRDANHFWSVEVVHMCLCVYMCPRRHSQIQTSEQGDTAISRCV